MRAGFTKDLDLNYEAVVFLDEQTGDAFEIQRSLEFDDQDRAMGMDTYCLVLGSGPTHYGGVAHWTLDDSALELVLTTDAAAALGIAPHLRLESTAQELRDIAAHLPALLSASGTS
jgi:hypothetical protein